MEPQETQDQELNTEVTETVIEDTTPPPAQEAVPEHKPSFKTDDVDNRPISEKLAEIASKKAAERAAPRTPDGKFAPKELGSTIEPPVAPEGTTNVAAPGETPIYVPNFKFKVMDKEMEIPEWARPGVTTEETERQAREIFEKAHGLDIVKPKYQQARDQLKEVAAENFAIKGDLNEARNLYQKAEVTGDWQPFFRKIQVPKEKVLQWLVNEIRFEQLPAEERAQITRQRQAIEEAEVAKQQAQFATQRYDEVMTQALRTDFNTALDRAEVKTFAESYDAKEGKPGAFQDLVISHGEWVEKNYGRVLSPDEAIQGVMKHFASQAAQPAAPAPAATPAAQVPQAAAPVKPAEAKAPLPVIPTIQGGPTSPAQKPKPRSIDDLKKLYAQYPASQKY